MIYLLYGEDNFRRSKALKVLKSKHIDPNFVSINYLELRNPSILEFSDQIRNCPLGFGEKLIVVKDAKFLVNKSSDLEVDQILDALSNLPEHIVVVFDSEKINGTIKLVKSLKKLSDRATEFPLFQAWDIKKASEWLMSEIKSMNESNPDSPIQINYEALNFLVEYIGTDSATLISELEKLSLLASSGGARGQRADVEAGSEITIDLIRKELKPKHDIFKFAKDLVVSKSSRQANSENGFNKKILVDELGRIVEVGELHIGFLSAVQTSVQRYLKAKLLATKPISDKEKAGELSISSGRYYYLKEEIREMNLDALNTVNDALYEIERKVKTGKSPLEREFRFLVAS